MLGAVGRIAKADAFDRDVAALDREDLVTRGCLDHRLVLGNILVVGRLDIEPLGEPLQPPRLAVLSEARSARSEYWPMESAGRLQASFRVSDDQAFSLAIVGGSALKLRTVELALSTFPAADGLSSQMSEDHRSVMVSSSRR